MNPGTKIFEDRIEQDNFATLEIDIDRFGEDQPLVVSMWAKDDDVAPDMHGEQVIVKLTAKQALQAAMHIAQCAMHIMEHERNEQERK